MFVGILQLQCGIRDADE